MAEISKIIKIFDNVENEIDLIAERLIALKCLNAKQIENLQTQRTILISNLDAERKNVITNAIATGEYDFNFRLMYITAMDSIDTEHYFGTNCIPKLGRIVVFNQPLNSDQVKHLPIVCAKLKLCVHFGQDVTAAATACARRLRLPFLILKGFSALENSKEELFLKVSEPPHSFFKLEHITLNSYAYTFYNTKDIVWPLLKVGMCNFYSDTIDSDHKIEFERAGAEVAAKRLFLADDQLGMDRDIAKVITNLKLLSSGTFRCINCDFWDNFSLLTELKLDSSGEAVVKIDTKLASRLKVLTLKGVLPEFTFTPAVLPVLETLSCAGYTTLENIKAIEIFAPKLRRFKLEELSLVRVSLYGAAATRVEMKLLAPKIEDLYVNFHNQHGRGSPTFTLASTLYNLKRLSIKSYYLDTAFAYQPDFSKLVFLELGSDTCLINQLKYGSQTLKFLKLCTPVPTKEIQQVLINLPCLIGFIWAYFDDRPESNFLHDDALDADCLDLDVFAKDIEFIFIYCPVQIKRPRFKKFDKLHTFASSAAIDISYADDWFNFAPNLVNLVVSFTGRAEFNVPVFKSLSNLEFLEFDTFDANQYLHIQPIFFSGIEQLKILYAMKNPILFDETTFQKTPNILRLGLWWKKIESFENLLGLKGLEQLERICYSTRDNEADVLKRKLSVNESPLEWKFEVSQRLYLSLYYFPCDLAIFPTIIDFKFKRTLNKHYVLNFVAKKHFYE